MDTHIYTCAKVRTHAFGACHTLLLVLLLAKKNCGARNGGGGRACLRACVCNEWVVINTNNTNPAPCLLPFQALESADCVLNESAC